MVCPIKVSSNTIKLTVHTSCHCVLDLLCVTCNPSNTGKAGVLEIKRDMMALKMSDTKL